MTNAKHILVALLEAIYLIVVAFFIGRWTSPIPEVPPPTIIEKIDTVIITEVRIDTVYKVRERVAYLERVDTLTNTVVDTVSVFVPIDRYVAHKDSLYHIEATGYDVEFEKIEVYPKTIIKEHYLETQRKSKFGIGVQAGYGASLIDNTVRLSPYVGIGISYNIFSW